MEPLVFALKFETPSPVPNPKGRNLPVTAESVKITTVIGPQGVDAKIEPVEGSSAIMINGFYQNNHNTGPLFFEWGTIKFGGETNTLTFSSIGAGTLLGELDDHGFPLPDANGFTHGTVMWKIDSGTGVFAGATGAITSNFLINLKTDVLIDYHFYIIYLPSKEK